MTQLLQQALHQVGQLPDADQDAIATLILEEIESERKWDAAFAGSQDVLAKLAEEALEECRAGRTLATDPSAR